MKEMNPSQEQILAYANRMAPKLAEYEAIMMLQILTPKHIDTLTGETYREEHHIERYSKFISNNYLSFDAYFARSIALMKKEFYDVVDEERFKFGHAVKDYNRHRFLDERRLEYAKLILEKDMEKEAQVLPNIRKQTYLDAIRLITPDPNQYRKDLFSLADPYAAINIEGAIRDRLLPDEQFFALHPKEIDSNIAKMVDKVYPQDKSYVTSVFSKQKIDFDYM